MTKEPSITNAEEISENPEVSAPESAFDGKVEDVFTHSTRVRKERGKSGHDPKITRKPMAIPVVTKMKAWFRTHPGAVYAELPIFIDPTSEDMEKKPYYVGSDLAGELEGSDGLSYQTGYLICTANSKNMLFLVKDADADGAMHAATEAKHEACADALKSWTRMTWDRDVMQYQLSTAEFKKKTPRWPEDLSEAAILRLAFGKQYLDDWDHPLLKSFRGED